MSKALFGLVAALLVVAAAIAVGTVYAARAARAGELHRLRHHAHRHNHSHDHVHKHLAAQAG